MKDRRDRHDHFFKKARADGYAARSVYKLEELDRRHGLLGQGKRVLDLGCAPGSWLVYAAKRVGASGRALGLDRNPVTAALPPQATALVGDVYETATAELRAAAGGALDLVLSDMAPDTSGVGFADAARSIDLADRALEIALEVLAPGGAFVVKVFQGAELEAYLARVRAAFREVQLEKPAASRKQSREIYVLARGRRGKVTPSGASPPA